MKVSVLSKSDTNTLLEKIRAGWPEGTVPKIKSFKVYEVEGEKAILKSNEENFTAVKVDNNTVIPFLGSKIPDSFPSVNVDMGAVKFVCNGAKVMRPGIVKFDKFAKGNIVVVRDQVHLKNLAIGIALQDSDQALQLEKGYVIDTLHYISDKFWEKAKEIGN